MSEAESASGAQRPIVSPTGKATQVKLVLLGLCLFYCYFFSFKNERLIFLNILYIILQVNRVWVNPHLLCDLLIVNM